MEFVLTDLEVPTEARHTKYKLGMLALPKLRLAILL